MIMNAALSPVFGLVVENLTFAIKGVVLATRENTIGVRAARSFVFVKAAVIFFESLAVVIPMARHGESIGDK